MSSLFNLNNIQFLPEQSKISDSGNIINKYGPVGSYRYPEDLGTLKYNHYVNFQVYIRDKTNSEFGIQTESGLPMAYQIRDYLKKARGSAIINGAVEEVLKKAKDSFDLSETQQNSNFRGGGLTTRAAAGPGWKGPSLFDTSGKAGSIAKEIVEGFVEEIKRAFNTLKKARESVTLYMPDTLNFGYNHSYSNQSLSENAAMKAGQYISAGLNKTSDFIKNSRTINASPFVSEILDNAFGLNGQTGTFSGALAYAVNPQIEVTYHGTDLRSFQFDFIFSPRSEKEAEQVHKIIETFKFHAAPEILSGTSGRFLLAPSAFDITFYYNGHENPNIPKISTCICDSVQVDYAPNGSFSAYESGTDSIPRIGKTGMPVSIRLQLGFKEMTLITKELIRSYATNTLSNEWCEPGKVGSF